jgi:hypothetical protein
MIVPIMISNIQSIESYARNLGKTFNETAIQERNHGNGCTYYGPLTSGLSRKKICLNPSSKSAINNFILSMSTCVS